MFNNYSVLMSVYKNENPKYFEAALISILDQTVLPKTIILVVDGPIGNNLEKIINKYSKHLTLVCLKKNVGLGLALNAGIKVCDTELIARMDTDDIMKHNRCEIQMEYFNKYPNASVIGSQIDEFIEVPGDINQSRIVPVDYDAIVEFSKRRNPFNHPSVMYKKSVIEKYNGYKDIRRNQDFELFVRLIHNGEFVLNTRESLLHFRANPDNLKRRKSWQKVSSDIRLSYYFKKIGHSSIIDFIIVSLSHLLFYILPNKLVKYFSNKFLRGKSEDL